VNDSTKGRTEREWFSITCNNGDDPNWVKNARERHEQVAKVQSRRIQEMLDSEDGNELMKSHWRFNPQIGELAFWTNDSIVEWYATDFKLDSASGGASDSNKKKGGRPIPNRPFPSMISDRAISGNKCSKRRPDKCPKGERCGLWIHDGDDREGCVNEYHCDTFGRLVNSDPVPEPGDAR